MLLQHAFFKHNTDQTLVCIKASVEVALGANRWVQYHLSITAIPNIRIQNVFVFNGLPRPPGRITCVFSMKKKGKVSVFNNWTDRTSTSVETPKFPPLPPSSPPLQPEILLVHARALASSRCLLQPEQQCNNADT
jgi:hypothetical protein